MSLQLAIGDHGGGRSVLALLAGGGDYTQQAELGINGISPTQTSSTAGR